MSDYYSTTAFRNAEIPSFQVNRAKLERDVLAMLLQYPNVSFLHATVKSVTLAERDAASGLMKDKHEIHLAQPSEAACGGAMDGAPTDAKSSSPLPPLIRGRHVLDCCGRRFLLGTQKKLMIKDPDLLEQVHNASVWIRVKGCNYDEFMKVRGRTAMQEGAGAAQAGGEASSVRSVGGGIRGPADCCDVCVWSVVAPLLRQPRMAAPSPVTCTRRTISAVRATGCG